MVRLNPLFFLDMNFQSFQKVISDAKLTDMQQTNSPPFWMADFMAVANNEWLGLYCSQPLFSKRKVYGDE